MVLRTQGPESTRETLLACARAAETAGLDAVWVPDHIAIPPDDAEGSGGRYLDPLGALLFLAGQTERLGLGTGALVLPYRPIVPTAKLLATLQELSGGRLRLGVGAGWMPAEFRAVGVDRSRRGALTDAALDFLNRAFAQDVVETHGQPWLFLPRPPRPPILVGGAAPHALERAARFGDGWLPMERDPDKLRGSVAELRERFAAAGRPEPQVQVMSALPIGDPARLQDAVSELARAGATGIIHFAGRYGDAGLFRKHAEALGELLASWNAPGSGP